MIEEDFPILRLTVWNWMSGPYFKQRCFLLADEEILNGIVFLRKGENSGLHTISLADYEIN